MNLAHNESIKLLATMLNYVAVACIVTGVVAPTAGFVYGVGQPVQAWRVVAAVLAWLVVGTGLHPIAQRVLRGLRE